MLKFSKDVNLKELPIYVELVARVDNGEPFSIDFEKRSMKVGKEYLIKNGEYDTSREVFDMMHIDIYSLQVALHMLRELYKNYKYSLPSERSDSKRKKYFKALPIEQIPDDKLLIAGRRETMQAALEGFILCAIITDQLKWDEEIMGGKWFYQSEKDPDLVLLRSWIENN
jgi:hypothetical protein